ncbi:hypothetical protein EUGRSUZ_I01137 [Eucalyptus grandis]|uniref:Uncharacterized protein n=2 Tax=Eucalyptus grandis TaxID=71139 RepID=A0ACC3JEC9_EUCGR|nr:hypothetical protein EUGRSUZ_I01137 [Eucalyptus grandis]
MVFTGGACLAMLALHSTPGKHIIFSDLKGFGVQDITLFNGMISPVCAGDKASRSRNIKSSYAGSSF